VTDAPSLAREALALAERGDDAAAQALFDEGLARFPGDARFANSAGNFHAKAGRPERALDLFEAALTIMPSLSEAAINAAIVLMRLDRPRDAATLLAGHVDVGNVRYWQVRGDAERSAGELAAAAASYESALQVDPGHARALAGRARIALERGESDAVGAYDRAFARNPGDPQVFRDLIQALATSGRLDEALECSAALVGQLPAWTEGLALHAELRWASGEHQHFTDHFASASQTVASADIDLAWAGTLSGVDRFADAAAVLAAAQARWPADTRLALARAVALGEAGNAGAAQATLDAFAAVDDPEWDLARGRIALQSGNVARAESLLERVRAARPHDVAAWALTDLCWRLTGDARHAWLHGQPGLVRQIALPFHADEFAAVRDRLTALHATSAMPIGQSVKQGSQTKGALFARMEPEIALLRTALDHALAVYRAGLPPADAGHPLLAYRDSGWAVTGSWSIRLAGQGHHAAHIHPRGLLSSASYFIVPDEVAADDKPGWLELGRPPKGLADDLGPLHLVEPLAGTCVLFPSTLFHGTRPIGSGIRMTAAFDVIVAPSD
jgi:tetratricopeptide (TPR) repeat protein